MITLENTSLYIDCISSASVEEYSIPTRALGDIACFQALYVSSIDQYLLDCVYVSPAGSLYSFPVFCPSQYWCGFKGVSSRLSYIDSPLPDAYDQMPVVVGFKDFRLCIKRHGGLTVFLFACNGVTGYPRINIAKGVLENGF